MSPAKKENDGVPTLADKNKLVVRTSIVNGVSPATTSKKFEFCGFKPFCVNEIAIFVPVTPVFFTVTNFDAYCNLISFVSPTCKAEDVRNGTAETWYAGAYPSLTNGWFNDIL